MPAPWYGPAYQFQGPVYQYPNFAQGIPYVQCIKPGVPETPVSRNFVPAHMSPSGSDAYYRNGSYVSAEWVNRPPDRG